MSSLTCSLMFHGMTGENTWAGDDHNSDGREQIAHSTSEEKAKESHVISKQRGICFATPLEFYFLSSPSEEFASYSQCFLSCCSSLSHMCCRQESFPGDRPHHLFQVFSCRHLGLSTPHFPIVRIHDDKVMANQECEIALKGQFHFFLFFSFFFFKVIYELVKRQLYWHRCRRSISDLVVKRAGIVPKGRSERMGEKQHGFKE